MIYSTLFMHQYREAGAVFQSPLFCNKLFGIYCTIRSLNQNDQKDSQVFFKGNQMVQNSLVRKEKKKILKNFNFKTLNEISVHSVSTSLLVLYWRPSFHICRKNTKGLHLSQTTNFSAVISTLSSQCLSNSMTTLLEQKKFVVWLKCKTLVFLRQK